MGKEIDNKYENKTEEYCQESAGKNDGQATEGNLKWDKKENYLHKTQENESPIDLNEIPNSISNYLQNITLSGSNGGFSTSEFNKSKQQPMLENSKTVLRFSPIWKQLCYRSLWYCSLLQALAAGVSILMTVTGGLTVGYSAILLPQLKEPNSPIPGDGDTASWIASMAALPMALGCLISGWIMEKFGRKTSHYIICAPFLIGWILIACAKNLPLMLTGRFLTGLCIGLLGPLSPVYIGETSEPKYRGFFLAGVSLAMAVGIFVAHLIGTFVSWQYTAAICALFPVVSVLLLLMVPESPTWLISKGRIEEGAKAFAWLRGFGEEAKIELKGLIENQKNSELGPAATWKEKIKTLKSPELVKPLIIMILFFVTNQFSGVNAVTFYSIEIIEKTVGKGLDHYLAMLIIDGVRVCMSVVACVVCRQYGRRIICFISGLWTALSMVGLSMYLYFNNAKESNLMWLPLTCLMVYICAVSIGLVPLPWIMCGEIFPIHVRGLGSGISSAVAFAAFFIVVKTAPTMMSGLGEVVTFLIYGIVALVGTFIMYFILPETKGKSLQEIEERFKKTNKQSVK